MVTLIVLFGMLIAVGLIEYGVLIHEKRKED